jgi:hypothetical protein
MDYPDQTAAGLAMNGPTLGSRSDRLAHTPPVRAEYGVYYRSWTVTLN